MKEVYNTICHESEVIPVFAQPWYLDIVTDGKWDVVLSEDQNARKISAWPYYETKKLGVSVLLMPAFCPYMGPIFLKEEEDHNRYKTNGLHFKHIQQLEEQLPKNGYINVKFYPDGKSWYPLFNKGYQQSTRYTYILNHKLGLDTILKNMKGKLRNVISKDRDDRIKVNDSSADSFLNLVKETLSDNNAGQFFDRKILSNIINSAVERGSGHLYSFDDQSAGVFTLEDQSKVYLLLTAKNQKGKEQDAVSHLIWRAIRDSVASGKEFDFEGSMLPGVERFFRSFGGEQVPYHQITKVSHPLIKVYKFLRP